MAAPLEDIWEIESILERDERKKKTKVQWKSTKFHCGEYLKRLVLTFPDDVQEIDWINHRVKWKPLWINSSDVNPKT